mgnify:FL=1
MCGFLFAVSAATLRPAGAQEITPAMREQIKQRYESGQLTPDQMQQVEREAQRRGLEGTESQATTNRYVPGTTRDTAREPAKDTSSENSTGRTATADMQAETLRTPRRPTQGDLSYFGYSLFDRTPEAFKPASAGPVDPGYILGPGDKLRLAVWGQVEFQYELNVSREGKVFIPVVGQVHVVGIPFEQLQEKITRLLSRHYSGIRTTPPRTFVDVGVAELRPVRIFIMGEVHNPGGYTVSSFGTVFNALYSVGGPTVKGSLREIAVYRDNEKVATVDLYEYLLEGAATSDVRLQNNDVVFVPPRGKTVAVAGEVFRPAVYELAADEKLAELLDYAGGITPNTHVERAHITRVLPYEEREPDAPAHVVIDIELEDYLRGSREFALEDRDSVALFSLPRDLSNYVMLSGAVQHPGRYQSDSLTLRRLIFEHGRTIEGVTYMKRADLVRFNDDLITRTTHPIDLAALKADPSRDRMMQPGDKVIVYSISVERPTDFLVSVDGRVHNPDTFELTTGMTVLDAIVRAGGFTRAAYRKEVQVFRMDTSTSEDVIAEVIRVPLPDSIDLTNSAAVPFQLRDRDRVVIRKDPLYEEQQYVYVRGLVRYPGPYAIRERGERISSIIDRAGGLMDDAHIQGTRYNRNGDRLVVDLEKAYLKKQRKEDVIVQPGDTIMVPSRPNAIQVAGRVNNEGIYGFVEDKGVDWYINRAGGTADSSHYVLFTRPNGETRKLRRGLFHPNPRVPDGSSIRVTKKPARPRRDKEGPSITEVVRDTLAIVTSAVTIIALVIQLER